MAVRQPRWKREITGRRGLPLVIVLAAGLALSACSGSGYTYVKNSETNAFFKVPEDWTLYDEEAVLAGQDLSPQRAQVQSEALRWLMAFDAHPDPSLDHLLDVESGHPAGFVLVRALNDEERDIVSLGLLRNFIFPVDDLAEQGRAELLEQEDLVLDGGLHGTRLLFNVQPDGDFLTVNQTGLVDPETRLLYVFAIGCEADCYISNEDLIEEVVSSWTVRER
jgi:hypothetical protein